MVRHRLIEALLTALAWMTHDAAMPEATTLGEEFARAVAQKDADGISALLHPEVDFRGLTPNRNWEASDRDAVVAILFQSWFEDSDRIEELVHLERDHVADRERVGYRLRVSCPDGPFLVEQQAYLAERDGQIGWMRVVCSGFRPLVPGA
jgi:hypothetical protein